MRASPGVDDAMRRLRKELEEERRGHAIARVALEAAERQLTELERSEGRGVRVDRPAKVAGAGAESPGAKLQQALQSALAGRERAGREIEELRRQVGQLKSAKGSGAEGRLLEEKLAEEGARRAEMEAQYEKVVSRVTELEGKCERMRGGIEEEAGKRAQAEENFKNVVARAKVLEGNCGELTEEIKTARKMHADAVRDGEAAKKVVTRVQREMEALRGELAEARSAAAKKQELESLDDGGAKEEINALSQVVRDMAAALKLAEEERDARMDEEDKQRELLAKLERMLDEQGAELAEAEKCVKVERARVQELEVEIAQRGEHDAAEWMRREAALKEELQLSRDQVGQLKAETSRVREQNRKVESELVLGLKDELREAETSLAHARSSLETARAALDVKAREIHGLEARFKAKEDELRAKDDELRTKEDELRAKEGELRSKDDELRSKDALLERRAAEVERLENEVEAAGRMASDKAEEFRSAIRDMEVKMEVAEQASKREVETLEERIAEASRGANTLQGALAEETATAKNLREKIAQLNEDLSQSAREGDALRQVADQSLKRASEAGVAHANEIRRMNIEARAQEAQIQKLEGVKRDLNGRLETMAGLVRSQVAEFRAELASSRESILKTREDGLCDLAHGRTLALDGVRHVGSALDALTAKLLGEASKRKKLQNIVADLRGNIRVHCRVRPPSPEESRGGLSMSRNVVSVIPDETGHGIGEVEIGQVKTLSGALTPARNFEFDGVYGPESTQADVFELSVLPLVSSVLDGYNACVFAYGQTGSGKTFTMEGPTVKGVLSDESMAGVNYRALEELFRGLDLRSEAMRRSGEVTEVHASCVEIYNETIRDLLDPENVHGASNSRGTELSVGRLHATGERVIQGLTEVPVGSATEVRGLMRRAARARATSATSMNERSSRSHSILMIKVLHVDAAAPSVVIRQSKLNLVDLAGSERVKKSEAAGDRMKEAQAINKSLSALGDVISALRTKQGHVPFRNSKLTYLLEDSLSGNSKILMFVNISPDERQVGETTCSLQFASRARAVELGRATKNTFQ